MTRSSSAGPSATLIKRVRGCALCPELPLGPRPVFQVDPHARILIAGQAPGRRVHESGVPFQDPSGDRLRDWIGVGQKSFYDSKCVAILPMAFCYPGTGSSGDLPPPPRCAETWRRELLEQLPAVKLTIIIGRYARDWHLPDRAKESLTETVANWEAIWPNQIVAPHPSPRNNRWLKRNPWFEADVLPRLKSAVGQLIN
ncbi:MAG: uracil-DNA glycosylase family protein [Alphaproteobacteria bacterium]|nr:uracil-DNA glycosylase family protein [Alphaproteobacteria bacterium]